MSWRRIRVACLSLAVLFVLGSEAFPQATTTTTTATSQLAGVSVDADGVLRMQLFTDRGGALSAQAIAAQKRSLNPDVAKASELRKISLNRLEAALRERLAAGEKPTEEMLFLAGLQRVKYVFCYPDTGDIVIAGPAEGWATDVSGRVRGFSTGGPVIELQDLIVALRAFAPTNRDTALISCSIDPTREGLANMQQFLSQLGRTATPNQTPFIVNGLRKSLGLQNVTIGGVSPETHFAQVLVEADYRMKLIGIGLERTSVKMKSYVDLASPAAVSRNAMQRWYFVPNYECVRASEDKLAMEMVGDGVKLIGADEMVNADGTRVNAGQVDKAGKDFVEGFTKNYPQLAKAVPVYAQLRNLIDLSVAAAYMQKEDLFGRVGWSMELFNDENAYPVHTMSAPQRVETAVASVWRGNRLMTPIGGGVNIQPRLAFSEEHLLQDDDGQVQRQHEYVTTGDLKPCQWWWD